MYGYRQQQRHYEIKSGYAVNVIIEGNSGKIITKCGREFLFSSRFKPNENIDVRWLESESLYYVHSEDFKITPESEVYSNFEAKETSPVTGFFSKEDSDNDTSNCYCYVDSTSEHKMLIPPKEYYVRIFNENVIIKKDGTEFYFEENFNPNSEKCETVEWIQKGNGVFYVYMPLDFSMFDGSGI
ncbi:MAG: hypothetical protein RsTaC01_0537 [Candidatus Paraimprobicoccus trichonymphae]|uniref:Uncharacterized protein n=1 Tax=Candidatus Paraimprobicoccus trichonymphae TaxID=3033793 RepID=A0AA48KZA3_9FIRM|nr:MAG: hypothetical protein RsTaC01_0537 [Candidatus Paraimprobicoccus trichonymphae]